MATPVPEGHYMPSPARERYYDTLAKSLINSTVRSDGTIKNDNLNEAITQLKAEKEAGHERNILDMTQVDEYISPGKNKHASTVNDSAYHHLDDYEDEISDSSKQVEAYLFFPGDIYSSTCVISSMLHSFPAYFSSFN